MKKTVMFVLLGVVLGVVAAGGGAYWYASANELIVTDLDHINQFGQYIFRQGVALGRAGCTPGMSL